MQDIKLSSQSNIAELIGQLVQWGYKSSFFEAVDIDYVRNQLMALYACHDVADGTLEQVGKIDDIMEQLLDYGYETGLIEHNTLLYRDMLDAKIMGLLLPRPSQFISNIHAIKQLDGLEKATKYFYDLSINSRYIRMDRVKLNPNWLYRASYGELQMTINLAKPEKDPKDIERMRLLPVAHYPKCLLCKENVGYEGRLDHPARQNLRTLPITLLDERWHLQYSPYVYYNEHSIVFKDEHAVMKITNKTFARLLDFVEQFPHYFVGSNADLPIVGGSILSHDHYQAGKHTFPMEHAKTIARCTSHQFPNVSLAILDWPLSVIRLSSIDKEGLLDAAVHVLHEWRSYSDEENNIVAYTEKSDNEKIEHNTVTPIARKREDGLFELDLVLRNNRTTASYPYGIFHPHEGLHHIKKENIGLIEAMGLAILPARLKEQLEQIAQLLCNQEEQLMLLEQSNHPLFEHRMWIRDMLSSNIKIENNDSAMEYVKQEVGKKFSEILQCAGVFKQNKHGIQRFLQFTEKIGYGHNN